MPESIKLYQSAPAFPLWPVSSHERSWVEAGSLLGRCPVYQPSQRKIGSGFCTMQICVQNQEQKEWQGMTDIFSDMKRLLIASTNARQDLTFEETMIPTSESASDCAGVAWTATAMEHDCHVQQMHRKASNLQVSNRNGANTWGDKRTREQIPDPCQRKEKQQRGDKQRAIHIFNFEDKWMRTKIILPGPGQVW